RGAAVPVRPGPARRPHLARLASAALRRDLRGRRRRGLRLLLEPGPRLPGSGPQRPLRRLLRAAGPGGLVPATTARRIAPFGGAARAVLGSAERHDPRLGRDPVP